MLHRRALLMGGVFAPVACALGPADDVRTPESFGARSGPLAPREAMANTLALKAALESGRWIDGGGRSYDIVGVLRPTAAPRVRRLTLRQRSLDSALEKTFIVDGAAGEVTLEDLTVDMMGLQQARGMNQCSAIQISYCPSAILRNVSVINGGGITGATLVSVERVEVQGFVARDFAPRYSREPTDDVCQGIEFQRCRNFRIRASTVRNLAAVWPNRPAVARQYSRGIVCGDSRDGVVEANTIGPEVEQGVDMSSSRGNRNLVVRGNRITDVGTWGVKCANRFLDIVIENNVIVRPGLGGITCSAPVEGGGEAPGRVIIRNNTITDVGASRYWAASEPAGIMLYGREEDPANAPSAIIVYGNVIRDTQASPTMARGLDATIVPVGGRGRASAWRLPRGATANREYSNDVRGFVVARARGWN
jgi:hypothetical protein